MIRSHPNHPFPHIFLLLLVLTALLLSATPADAQATASRPNIVGLEILGRGLLYSANYERHFNRLGLGVGFASWNFSGNTVLIVPMYASFRPIGDANSLYIAGGATVGSESRTFLDKPLTFGTIAVGFEHRSISGLVIRPTTTFAFDRDDRVWWPGLLVGFRF
jgi:hypothetical protein